MARCPMVWLTWVLKEPLASKTCQRPTAPFTHVDETTKSLDTESCLKKIHRREFEQRRIRATANSSNAAFEESSLQPMHPVERDWTCRSHAPYSAVFVEINPQFLRKSHFFDIRNHARAPHLLLNRKEDGYEDQIPQSIAMPVALDFSSSRQTSGRSRPHRALCDSPSDQRTRWSLSIAIRKR